ncbi:MAG: sce7725 family protein [Pseudomonadales bacterium]|nr:sce7725 family protein [Pseudomonadales bacterium]
MYYPYFRGKQYELIAIRESAAKLKQSGFIPIIEPVKESLGGLSKALKEITKNEGEAIVIVNPFHGDHSSNAENISELLKEEFEDSEHIHVGLLLTEDLSINEVISLYKKFTGHRTAFVHAGFSEAKFLAEALGEDLAQTTHIFHEDHCGKLYRRHFKASPNRVLIRDGFVKRKNREHPATEFFSDLHITYSEEGMQGFSDFLIVGDEYSESGGPAYAIAIHVTYIDNDKDGEMHIHHFLSDRQDDPKDPAGKFAEALDKLAHEVNSRNSKITMTTAIEEFLALHDRQHFPGLGYVKKLSMQHHIETLADFFKEE